MLDYDPVHVNNRMCFIRCDFFGVTIKSFYLMKFVQGPSLVHYDF